MDSEALPEGVMQLRLSPKALAIANAILQTVKSSGVIVTQILQETVKVPDREMNGVLSTKALALAEQYKEVQQFESTRTNNRALYMHNKSLIQVAGADLVHQLYKATNPLKQDVLVNYPLLYISDNPKSSNDVLIGGTGSWSPVHRDLPLYCTSAILVLEGHKEFAVVTDDVAASLRVNLTSWCWDKPFLYKGKTFPNLESLVRATGGAVLTLKPGDLMIMPPRMFHLARNCAATVSCNFSVCSMENVPLAVERTFTWMEQVKRDEMRFDVDFAKLLEDCTNALIAQTPAKASSLHTLTSRGRLPAIRSILHNNSRLSNWFMLLQCIPDDWVEGFWGDVQDRLLFQLWNVLSPLYYRNPPAAAGAAAESSGNQQGAPASLAGLLVPAAGAVLPTRVPRPLSTTGRATSGQPQWQQQEQQRRLTRADTAAAAAAAAMAEAAPADGEAAPSAKRAKLGDAAAV